MQSKINHPQPPKQIASPLWSHQREAFWFAYNKPAAMIAGGMGVGKSATSISLAVNWGAKRILVVCPPSVRGVWRHELPKHCGDSIRPIVLEEGSVADRTAQADAALRDPSPAAIIVNTEASWREPFASWAVDRKWDLAMYDEAHSIKGNDSVCSAFASKLTSISGHRLCLTGTPLAHSPLDAWGQYRFLEPSTFGSDYERYLKRYWSQKQIKTRQRLNRSHNAMAAAIVAMFGNDSELLTDWEEGRPDWTAALPGLRNTAEFEQRIAPITWRCKSEDVLDLPPLVTCNRYIRMDKEGQEAYNHLEHELRHDMWKSSCSATSYLALMTRLQQVTSGFLPDSSGKLHRVDAAKADALYDLLAETNERAVVFCRYTHDLDTVQMVAEVLGRRYGELSGRRRDALTPASKLAPDVEIAGVMGQSGGVGVDLSAAKLCVWYSLARYLAQYDQGIKRLHRPGTTGVRVCSLIVQGTIDEEIHQCIADRRDIVEGVWSRMKRRTSG